MYSIVLLAATATGPTTPAADHTPAVVAAAPVAAGCCGAVSVGCYGCGGYAYASCYGSCHGARVGLFHRHRASCHGCTGSCGGWSCFGSCHGCYGSCWGSYSYGCWGSCYGSYAPTGSCHGCWGSGYGCGGGVVIVGSAAVAPAGVAAAAPTGGANVRFQLPADATLYVDGNRVAGTGAERAFYTPPLAAGQRYFYDVKAEVVVNGQTVTEEKRVVVTTGAEVVESFPKLTAAVANPTTVAGR